MDTNLNKFEELINKGWRALKNKEYIYANDFFEEAHFLGVFSTATHFRAHYAKLTLCRAQHDFWGQLLQIFLLFITPLTPITYFFYKIKTFLPMHPKLKKYFEEEITKGKLALQNDSVQEAWHHFGRAHILGNHFFFAHTRTHFLMLCLEWKSSYIQGIFIQLSRFLGAFGTRFFVKQFGVTGNPGWSKYPIGTRLPLSADLKNILRQSGILC